MTGADTILEGRPWAVEFGNCLEVFSGERLTVTTVCGVFTL